MAKIENLDPHMDHQYSCRKWALMEPEEVLAKFHEKTMKASVKARKTVPHQLDIEYGSGERQKYDLYGVDLPPDSGIVVFIHGGYWQDVSKESSAVIVKPLHAKGLKVVVVDYDLAPKVKLEDIVREIKEFAHHILEYAQRMRSNGLWLIGHSAGAHLASALLCPTFQKTLPPDYKNILQGMVLISGIYDISPLIHTSINEALQLTSITAQNLSTHNFFKEKTNYKIFVTVAKNESPEFHRQSAEICQNALLAGNTSKLLVMEQSDHFTIIEDLCNSNFELTLKIIHFVQTGLLE